MALFSESLQNHKLYRLLRRLAESDETAMDELYRDYSGFIYFHIMNMTDNKSIAEEILQEVFLHLAMLTPDQLPRFGATSWLAKVTHNMTVSYLKKREMRLVSLPSIDALSDAEAASLISRNAEAASLISRNMEDRVINRIYVGDLLSILKPETQQILRLRQQGFSFNEIAEQLGMNPVTVRSRYSRAMQKIKEVLGEQDDT